MPLKEHRSCLRDTWKGTCQEVHEKRDNTIKHVSGKTWYLLHKRQDIKQKINKELR
ncbi:hypothetical protein DPMN_139265 [Dreissena polymorpha]|uniref:Uncharacterized protein n=1 Tax=Dreissena polymorpha TaxID=45954 RepID=A0A9D4G600_DREPO|nr:hypothetical protein DPMN_139265 [Dreissena polymorpha]